MAFAGCAHWTMLLRFVEHGRYLSLHFLAKIYYIMRGSFITVCGECYYISWWGHYILRHLVVKQANIFVVSKPTRGCAAENTGTSFYWVPTGQPDFGLTSTWIERGSERCGGCRKVKPNWLNDLPRTVVKMMELNLNRQDYIQVMNLMAWGKNPVLLLVVVLLCVRSTDWVCWFLPTGWSYLPQDHEAVTRRR